MEAVHAELQALTMFSVLPTRCTQISCLAEPFTWKRKMTADEIIAIADASNCKPNTSGMTFAKMLAEHCAHVADEAERARASAARAIRKAFALAES
jgi:hypothetical protein